MLGLTHCTRDPSIVYGVFQPAQVFDMCRNWLGALAGPPTTETYALNQLSSLEYRPNAPPATKVMNFADLPCPPSDVAEVYDSSVPYSPILAPSPLDVTMGIKNCTTVAVTDPPGAGVAVTEISKREDDGGGAPP